MIRGVSCRSELPSVHSSEPRHTISLGHHTRTSGWSWWDVNQVLGSPGELIATSYTVGAGIGPSSRLSPWSHQLTWS